MQLRMNSIKSMIATIQAIWTSWVHLSLSLDYPDKDVYSDVERGNVDWLNSSLHLLVRKGDHVDMTLYKLGEKVLTRKPRYEIT
ncbi:hypothetical protein L1987_54256 [Smallanthus sonchifolius]|uniref:Uncharacterized protein n=1 Tax=Smallanthus sonchifolius TaxID=185202 RepID=A0ACB9E6M5_9ASTR|nr:hypothetical protein L1987_54256 [Smallanthus sonchifolius]